MPSWKKVITSGSDAALNSLNVSTSLTASGIIYPTTDGTSGQVVITDGNGNLSFSNVENTTISIKNVSGGTILKGTPCYITGSGTAGNLAGVFPADASNPLRMPAGVIAGETLNDGDEGMGLINGFISGVNTSAFNAGDSVYVAVGGGYTNVRPTGSSILVQKLGNVEKSHVSNGSGVINGPGYYNDLPNIQQGYTWVGNSNGVAVAVATSSIQNVVSASYAATSSFTTAISGTTNYVSKFTGANTLGDSSISDTGTQVRIGNFNLGVASTTLNLAITGSTRFSAERNAFIEIFTNASNSPRINGYGNGVNITTSNSYGTSNGNINLQPQLNSSIINTVTGTGVQTWSTGGSERMRITDTGNVGINTTSPSARLDVNGNMIVGAGNKSIGGWPFYISDSSNLGWKVSDSSGTAKFELYVGNGGINQMRLLGGVSIVGFSQDLSLGTSAYLNTVNISNTNGNVGIGTTTPNSRLDVNGNTIITGSLAVSQSLLQYSNTTSVTSGSTSNVASFNTSSYTAAFFDYVTTSGTNARAGTVFIVWNGNNVEYTETSTNDIGNTNNLVLSASLSAGAIRLQATSLSGSWSVKTLARMI